MAFPSSATDLLRSSNSLELIDTLQANSTVSSSVSRLMLKLSDLLYCEDIRFNPDAYSLELLLESSGFHFRRSNIEISNNSSQPPIVFVPIDGSYPCILYCLLGKNCIYSPSLDSYSSVLNYTDLPQEGYELYAPLPPNIQSIKTLYSFLFPVILRDSLIAIILALFLALFELVTPWLTSQVVGNVLPSGNLALLLNAFIVGLLITLFSSAFTWLQASYLSRIQHKVSQRLQVAVYDRVMKLPLEFIQNYSTGEFASRVNGLQKVARSLSGSPLAALISSLSLVGYALLMFFYDYTLALWSVSLILIGGCIQFFIARRQVQIQGEIERTESDVYQLSLQLISSIPQIRSNASEIPAIKSWFEGLTFTTSKQYKGSSTEAFSELVSEVVSTGGKVVLFAVVIIRMLGADTLLESLTTATTFIIFSATYDSMTNKFTEVISVVNDLIGSTYLLWERALPILMHHQEKGYSNLSPIYKDSFTESLDLKDLSFAYPGSPNFIFESLSCSFVYGKFNAIFGPSGCGKSTLFNLILRFYSPSSGSISIDGSPVDDIFIKDYRRLFGVILQKPSLSAGSVRDAISCGLNYKDVEIWEALEFANAANEFREMPMGLETMLSEGASNLSGGQRQRLAIARAIIRKPKILLEDEATSALDSTSQSIISSNLLAAGITRIVVAHRLSAISDCDKIIVLNSGVIEAEGSFKNVSRQSQYLSRVIQESSFTK